MKLFKGCNEGVHKFEPRYDEIPPDSLKTNEFSGTVGGFEIMIQALTKHVYVKDVCVRCGKEIKR